MVGQVHKGGVTWLGQGDQRRIGLTWSMVGRLFPGLASGHSPPARHRQCPPEEDHQRAGEATGGTRERSR